MFSARLQVALFLVLSNAPPGGREQTNTRYAEIWVPIRTTHTDNKMNTHEINDALKTYHGFKGTWPCDAIPAIAPREGVVVNTDAHSQPGEHWVAIYRPLNGPVEYFDSFGLPPLVTETINYLQRTSSRGWTYSMTPIQDATTDSCGHHCINFLKHRLSGLPMGHIINHFTHDQARNDYIVKHSI